MRTFLLGMIWENIFVGLFFFQILKLRGQHWIFFFFDKEIFVVPDLQLFELSHPKNTFFWHAEAQTTFFLFLDHFTLSSFLHRYSARELRRLFVYPPHPRL